MPGQIYYKGQQIITPTLGGGNALAMFLGDVSVGYDARYNFISASGGTITTSGSFKFHTFTGSGDFVVHRQGFGELFLVAGGGGGGNNSPNGGGGAGGVINLTSYVTSSTYSIVIGAGGAGGRGQNDPSNGGNTTGFGLTAIGGGKGGYVGLDTLFYPAANGGSGGGGSQGAGLGLQPSQSGDSGTYGFGNNGSTAGGGGGAGAAATSGNGGNGVLFEGVYYAGGGGAANGFAGGLGGGGQGANQSGNCSYATTGSPNTGGGGGGGGSIGSCPPGFVGNNLGFAGGSGIVIIKYQYKL